MKSVLTLLLCLVASVSFGQSSENLALSSFKGCNTIIVEAKDSSQVLFNRFLSHLEDQGYVIESSDKDRLTFATNYKQYKKNLSPTMAIKGHIRANRIYLSGFIKSNALVGVGNETQAEDRGMGGSPMKEAFLALEHTAGLFTNSSRYFTTR